MMEIKKRLIEKWQDVITQVSKNIISSQEPTSEVSTKSKQPKNSCKQRYSLGQPFPDAFLTARQADCLYLLCTNLTRREVAVHLGISLRTVETHITTIKEKLNIRSQKDLVAQVKCSKFLVQYAKSKVCN